MPTLPEARDLLQETRFEGFLIKDEKLLPTLVWAGLAGQGIRTQVWLPS